MFPNEEKEGREQKKRRKGKEVMRFFRCLLHTQRGSRTGSNKCHSRIPSFSPPLSFGWVRSLAGYKRFVAAILPPTIIAAIVVVSRTATSKDLTLDVLFASIRILLTIALFCSFGNALVVVSLGCLLLLFFFFFFFFFFVLLLLVRWTGSSG